MLIILIFKFENPFAVIRPSPAAVRQVKEERSVLRTVPQGSHVQGQPGRAGPLKRGCTGASRRILGGDQGRLSHLEQFQHCEYCTGSNTSSLVFHESDFS